MNVLQKDASAAIEEPPAGSEAHAATLHSHDSFSDGHAALDNRENAGASLQTPIDTPPDEHPTGGVGSAVTREEESGGDPPITSDAGVAIVVDEDHAIDSDDPSIDPAVSVIVPEEIPTKFRNVRSHQGCRMARARHMSSL